MPGPAAATQIMSRLGLRSAANFTGTGFAYPNRNGAWLRRRIPGRITVPKGSMCLSGFKETRPSFQAVSSPK